jgi:alanine dehydrogenase
MKVGIAKENRPAEKRVILQPAEFKGITPRHEVLVEKGAGVGVGILDSEYENIGARIVSQKDVYASDLVIRIKEPNFDEIKMMRPGSAVMSMMHLRCRPKLEEALKNQRLIAISLENLKDPLGDRLVEAVLDSGRIGMEYGFRLWKRDPATCQVKIMGYGNMARGAIRCAGRKLARVEILNRSQFTEMEKHIPGTDILVDAINRPYRRDVEEEPYLVTRDMLKLFKPGSVIVDLVSNPEKHAPVQTMRPTTLRDLYYTVDGIYHTSCWGWPGLEPVRISKRYSKQVAPILKEIADNGLDKAPEYVQKAMVRFDAE